MYRKLSPLLLIHPCVGQPSGSAPAEGGVGRLDGRIVIGDLLLNMAAATRPIPPPVIPFAFILFYIKDLFYV